MLREVRQLVTYRSRLFKRVEKDRQDQKAEAAREREIEEKKQRRCALIRAEAAKIKIELQAEEQSWTGRAESQQEEILLREAEENLIKQGLLLREEPEESEKSEKKSSETAEDHSEYGNETEKKDEPRGTIRGWKTRKEVNSEVKKTGRLRSWKMIKNWRSR